MDHRKNRSLTYVTGGDADSLKGLLDEHLQAVTLNSSDRLYGLV